MSEMNRRLEHAEALRANERVRIYELRNELIALLDSRVPRGRLNHPKYRWIQDVKGGVLDLFVIARDLTRSDPEDSA